MTHKQRLAIAGEMYREMVAAEQDNPGAPQAREERIRVDKAYRESKGIRRGVLSGRFGNIMNEFLERKGIVLSVGESAALLGVFADAVTQANEHLLKNANGDYSPDPKTDRFPEFATCGQPLLQRRTAWQWITERVGLT